MLLAYNTAMENNFIRVYVSSAISAVNEIILIVKFRFDLVVYGKIISFYDIFGNGIILMSLIYAALNR